MIDSLCRITVLVIVTCITGGCVSPPKPLILEERADPENAYSNADFEADKKQFHTLIESGPEAEELAKFYRNEMFWAIVNDIDYAYFVFREDFHLNRASMDTIADVAQLGMSTAATALGGSVILSAAITAVKGAQLSVDKNFLREKTTESIFTMMDALRQQKLASVQRKLLLKPTAYGFQETYNDALEYYNAGTVMSALQGISAQAGSMKVEADEKRELATAARVWAELPLTTRMILDKTEQVRSIIEEWTREPDANEAKMRAFLEARGHPAAAGTSSAQLAELVRDEWRDVPPGDDKAVTEFLRQLQNDHGN